MAQLIVRNLDDNIKHRLQQRARQSGRSLEGEVREILRAAAAVWPKKRISQGFGTRFSAYFKHVGFDLDAPPREEPRAPDLE